MSKYEKHEIDKLSQEQKDKKLREIYRSLERMQPIMVNLPKDK